MLSVKLHSMSLLKWIELVLEKVAPNIELVAGTIASAASILASISWLISQALGFIKVR